jgi:hypothetical protein
MAVIQVAPPFSSGALEPVVLVGENIGVWTQQTYKFFKVVFIESVPPSRQLIQDLGAVADAANSGQTEFTVSQAQDGSLLQVRLLPLDKVEIEIAQQRATVLHTTDTQTARPGYWAYGLDPNGGMMTHWVLGSEKNMYINAYNVSGYALAQTRVLAWGFRYILNSLPDIQTAALLKYVLGGDLADEERTMLQRGLHATLVAAEGRS